ncbi:hypothetical protein LCGC14_0377970 [marine sediment metagenome]|uniref:Uncharacterized protein n=1 Tax=marine sediment metagenome TaxID=412755 RepID=A0A0F9T912_9ZZZZ
MNDKSKKLARYRKLLNEEAGTPFEIREMWVAAFEKMLKIIDLHPQDDARDQLKNVRRAILDELGVSGDAKVQAAEQCKHTRQILGKCPDGEILMRKDCGEPVLDFSDDRCDCKYDSDCGEMKRRCKSTPNLERIKRLKAHDKVLAEARKKAADYAALPQAARKFYGVAIHDERVRFEKKRGTKCPEK